MEIDELGILEKKHRTPGGIKGVAVDSWSQMDTFGKIVRMEAKKIMKKVKTGTVNWMKTVNCLLLILSMNILTMMCDSRSRKPCHRRPQRDVIVKHVIHYRDDRNDNAALCKQAYKRYMYKQHGYIGKRRNILLPQHIMAGTSAQWLDAKGNYIRLKRS